MSGDYAAELTGFEQRLLDGLREVRPEPPRRNWRPLVALAATAAVVVGAALVVPSVVDHPEPPAPPLAQPVAAKPFSYVRAVQGTRYVTMEGGGEVWSEVRASAELWVSNAPASVRSVRLVLAPYQQFSCTSSVADSLCVDWLGRHKELNHEPVDRTLPEAVYPVEPGETDLPDRIRPLFPDALVTDPALPVEPRALDARVAELARDWHQQHSKMIEPEARYLDQTRWHLLVEIAGKPTASPALRSAAIELASALPVGRTGTGTDRLGRPGTKLTFGHDSDLRTEVLFDPRTSTLLSIEEFSPVPPDTRRPPTPLHASDYTLFEQTATVSSPTERP
ncbi:hypothetical protein [Amycolatopsis magusensis]|uniref:hypothetical protein n=1 Tax=Amycolatopsis magusensis TaxID=882444 RepID=UPI0024A860C7|nr:hypothetical protein [Amycolatopsis magusensis]MDI5981733.1 hypothetical protein [Amycolatopsis magusensis]